MPCHPGQLSQRYEARRPTVDRRDGAAGWGYSASRQVAGYGDASDNGRARADGGRICRPFAQSGLPSQSRGAYRVRCKRGGSRAGLADVDADDVARQIAVAFLDYVAQMNADVELDAALSGQS